MPLLRVDDQVIPSAQSGDQLTRAVIEENTVYCRAKLKDGGIAPFRQDGDSGTRVALPQRNECRDQQHRIPDPTGADDQQALRAGNGRCHPWDGEEGRDQPSQQSIYLL